MRTIFPLRRYAAISASCGRKRFFEIGPKNLIFCTVPEIIVIRSLLKAGVAQLVEHNLAKVGVTSSNLATRSIFYGNNF